MTHSPKTNDKNPEKPGLMFMGRRCIYCILALISAIGVALLVKGVFFETPFNLIHGFMNPSVAYAQNANQPSANSDQSSRDLSRVLEAHAKRLLERHLKPEEFDIIIKATAKSPTTKDLPYVPELLGTRPFDSLSLDDLTTLVSKLEITVMLLPSFKESSKKQIQNILTQRLTFDSGRGDSITFAILGFEVKNQALELEKTVSKFENEARDYKAKIDALTQERDKATKELEQKKTELEQKKAELDKQRLEAGKEALNSNQIMMMAIALAGTFLIATVFVGLSLRAGAKNMGAAVAAIGNSVNVFGDKLADSMASQGALPGGTIDARSIKSLDGGVAAAPVRPLPSGSPGLSGQGISFESMQARIMTLHKELSGALTEVTEGLVISHIGRLLESDSGVSRAVATLELLGEIKARDLFQKLGPEHQTMISDFMRSGRFDQPKGEMMIDAGEELKTKLLGEMFGSKRGQRSDKVAMRLLQLGPEDIADALKNLSAEGLPRILYYFEPKRLGHLFVLLKQRHPEQYARAMKLLSKVPEVEGQVQLDEELISVLDEQINSNKEDNQRLYFGWYKALAEAIGEDLVDDFTKELSASNARLERFVSEQIITFGTFHKLDETLRSEILLGLQNKDLAALIFGLAEQERNTMLQIFDERRRDLVAEEMDRLSTKGQRLAMEAHKTIRKRVITQMRTLQTQGLLTLGKGASDTGKTPSSQESPTADDSRSAA